MHFTLDATKIPYESQYRLGADGIWAPLAEQKNPRMYPDLQESMADARKPRCIRIGDKQYFPTFYDTPVSTELCLYPQLHGDGRPFPVITPGDLHTALVRDLRPQDSHTFWPALCIDGTATLVMSLQDLRQNPAYATYCTGLGEDDIHAIIRDGEKGVLLNTLCHALLDGYLIFARTNRRGIHVDHPLTEDMDMTIGRLLLL